MSLRLEVQPRNYELERIKALTKPKQVRDHPLANVEGGMGKFGGAAGLQLDSKVIEEIKADKENEIMEEEEGGIDAKV